MTPTQPKAAKPLLRLIAMWSAAAAVVGALVVGYVTYSGLEDKGMRADPNDAAQLALGRQIYAFECASCHGDRLQGQPNWRQRRASSGRLPAPPHDETGHTWHHSDELLFTMTKRGPAALIPAGYQTDMPAYASKLDDREIWAVLAFIKSRWPKVIRDRQDAITRRDRQRQRRSR